MRGGLRPYPAYRDSGVEWLGDIPEHWEVRRLKTHSDIRYGLGQPPREAPDGLPMIRATNVSRGQIIDDDMVYVDPIDVPAGRNAFLSEGEIIVVRSGAYTADSAIVPKRYSGAVTGYDMVVTVTGALPAFVAFAVLAPYIRDAQLTVASLRAAQPHLNAEELGSAVTVVPSRSEQAAIARFLDHADRRIRLYIRCKERLIELLEEEKQATIHQVITGQVNVQTGQPYPAYKDSGVEWLGKVPEHWEVRRLGSVADLRVSNVDKHTRRNEQPIRLCNYVDVYKNDNIHDGLQYMRATATDAEITKFRLVVGDVVVTKDSEDWTDIGVPALVEEATEDLICGYHLAILRPKKRVLHGPYLTRVLKATLVRWQFAVAAAGVTRYGLARDSIRSIEIPLPTLRDQRAIAGSIDSTANRLDAAIAATRRQIDLLRECRTRLIADVVTGKLDIRDAAAELPSEGDLASDRARIPASTDGEGRSTCAEAVS